MGFAKLNPLNALDSGFIAKPKQPSTENPFQLSIILCGGEQQMLAVPRDLMADPKILMFDELSLGLATVLVLSLFETLSN
jgi:ABC-type branched-subunit amino acid transport system ATPase component